MDEGDIGLYILLTYNDWTAYLTAGRAMGVLYGADVTHALS